MQIVERTREAYDEIFERERGMMYPAVAAIEEEYGFCLRTDRYLAAARVLACPLKVNPPNWQHGRILYAIARKALQEYRGKALILDIGTAKGYSALCLQWALIDSGAQGRVVSVDVVDPRSRDRRNSVAELDGAKTLTELLDPWPEASAITFQQSTGIDFLKRYKGRVDLAFVDGKHAFSTVAYEGELLAERQQAGDVVMFDDVHLPGVSDAVMYLDKHYAIRRVSLLVNRAYAIGVRR